MYFETVKNLLCDEVAETIAAIRTDNVIEYKEILFRIPRADINKATDSAMAWRDGILHGGLVGNLEVLDANEYMCGTIPVRTVINLISHDTFVIRSALKGETGTIINNAKEFAKYLETTVESIPAHVRDLTDYDTTISLRRIGIRITTTAGETGKTITSNLLYPFGDDTYQDTITGHQCWADATYWAAVNSGEV